MKKIVLWVSGIIVSLIIAFAFSAGPLGKYLILKYGPEYIGRKIELEDLKVNVFNASTKFSKLKIYEVDGKSLFFSIDKFDVDLNLISLFAKKIKIESLGLENPNLVIKKIGDKYNFLGILENIESKSEKKKNINKDSNQDILISDLDLKNFNFEYKDNLMEKKFSIKLDNFRIPQMEIGKEIDFSFYVLSKKNLEINSKVHVNDKEVNIDNKKVFINMESFLPFIQTALKVSKFRGHFIGENKIKVDLQKGGIAFSGKNLYKGLEIVTKDNESLIKIDTINLDLEKFSTIDNSLVIKKLSFENPIVNLELFSNGSNFNKMLYDGPAKTIKLENYKVEGLELHKGTLNLVDSTAKEKFNYNFYNVDIKNTTIAKDIEGFSTVLSFNPNNENSFLKADINFKNKKWNDYEIKLHTKDLVLGEFTHYIKNSLNISSIDGKLDTDMNIIIKNGKQKETKLLGEATLKDLSVIDSKKYAEILKLKSFKVSLQEADIQNNRYIIKNMTIDAPRFYGYRAKDGNIMQLLLPTSAKKSKKSEKVPFLVLKEFNLKNGFLKFSDDSFANPFTYIVEIPSVTAKNISSKKDNRNSEYRVDLITNKKGRISAQGSLRIGNEIETDSTFKITNFDLSDFKDVSQKYTNFTTNSGTINYEGTFKLKNNQISSENNAKIYKIDIGEKDKILPLGISLNFVLSIIEDDNEEVTVILPVLGDLKDPQFKYWKTIRIALVNMFTNIAVSPFKFLMSSDNEDKDLENLDVQMGENTLPEKTLDKLSKIAGIIGKKKLVNFEFVQVVDKELEYNKVLSNMIKKKYYKEKNKIDELTLKDEEEIDKISDLDADLINYINKRTSDLPNAESLDMYERSQIILGKDKVEEAFNQIYKDRDNEIIKKLTELGIENTRYSVREATDEEKGELSSARYIVKVKQNQ